MSTKMRDREGKTAREGEAIRQWEVPEMDHGEKARENFESGMNCAQSVFCAFLDVTGFEPEQALRLSSPFGAGIGRMRETCGAVSGACMVIGELYGYSDLNGTAQKAELYRFVQDFVGRFQRETGSMWCHELLGLTQWPSDPDPSARTAQYYASRPCPGIVATAARILDGMIAERRAEPEKGKNRGGEG